MNRIEAELHKTENFLLCRPSFLSLFHSPQWIQLFYSFLFFFISLLFFFIFISNDDNLFSS